MRGAAMSSTAASSGFVVILLLTVPVIHGQKDWGVNYAHNRICASKGSTVEIRCTYRYPSRVNDSDTVVRETFWFTDFSNDEPVDLRTDLEFSRRVQYLCSENNCTLRITDLRESDSAVYKFSFTTNQPDGGIIDSPGTTLTVTGLQVKMSESVSCIVQGCIWSRLECHSSCLPGHSSYVWYENGKSVQKDAPSFEQYFHAGNSYSCALKGQEDFPSPSLCVYGVSCNRVTYTKRNRCAFSGSSVNISCEYDSNHDIKSMFWFRFQRNDHHRQPEDLNKTSQYSGRVQFLETQRGRSILRISNLTKRDSAEYRFKFITNKFEWESSLPGTTLAVKDPHVSVKVIGSSTGPKLICHSNCRVSGRPSLIWYKNEREIQGETTPSFSGHVDLEYSYSCAYEGHRSAAVYAPKVASVSMSHPDDMIKNSSVMLTCSSDANPPATYTWYKNNQSLLSPPQLVFTSIQLSDSGEYYCTAENVLKKTTSECVSVDVKYAPQTPTLSVSPSAEMVEGSSVTLNCSSDANPAANYTWYKEDEDSPKASGQIFTITYLRPEHSGNYSCEAQNTIGRQKSTLNLTVVVSGSWKLAVSGTITVVLLVLILLTVFLWIRSDKFTQECEQQEKPDNGEELNMDLVYESLSWRAEEGDEIHYAYVSFPQNQEDPVYSNIRVCYQRESVGDKEETEYSVVQFEAKSESQARWEEDGVDPFALYSTVNKNK